MKARDENIALETVLSEASVAEEKKNTTSTSREQSEDIKHDKGDTSSDGAGWIKTALAWVLYGLLLLLCFLADIPKYYD